MRKGRKWLLGLCCAMMVFTSIGKIQVQAETIYTEKYFEYKIEEESIIICGYFGSEKEITIPASIAGYPVSVIETGAFMDDSMEKINLPDTIMEIQSNAIPVGTTLVYNSNVKGNEIVGEAGGGQEIINPGENPGTGDSNSSDSNTGNDNSTATDSNTGNDNSTAPDSNTGNGNNSQPDGNTGAGNDGEDGNSTTVEQETEEFEEETMEVLPGDEDVSTQNNNESQNSDTEKDTSSNNGSQNSDTDKQTSDNTGSENSVPEDSVEEVEVEVEDGEVMDGSDLGLTIGATEDTMTETGNEESATVGDGSASMPGELVDGETAGKYLAGILGLVVLTGIFVKWKKGR